MITTNSRNWHPEHPVQDDIVRIRCIGDSITYGAGVAAYESLPFQLSTQLNTRFPLVPVEVVNNGLISGNIWNSWENVRHPAREHDCAAYVFQLCANDAKILNTYRVDHSGSLIETWNGTHPDIQAVLECTFDDIASFAERTSIPVIILFYAQASYHLATADIVGEHCERRNIPFLNVPAMFEKAGMLNADELSATLYDSHPSGQAHGRVANELAQMIRRRKLVPALESYSSDAPVDQAIRDAVVGGIRAGGAAEGLLNWGLQTLKTKQAQVRRLSEFQDLGTLDEDIRRTAEGLGDVWQRWVRAQIALATATAFEDMGSDFFSRCDDISGQIKRFREGLAVLEDIPDEPVRQMLGERIPDRLLFANRAEPSLAKWLENQIAGAGKEIADLSEGLQRIYDGLESGDGLDEFGISRTAAAAESAVAPFRHFLKDAAANYSSVLPPVLGCVERLGLSEVNSLESEPAVSAVAATAQRLGGKGRRLARAFAPQCPVDTPLIGPWTRVDIRFENSLPDERGAFQSVIWMRCYYDSPKRWPLHQTHTVRFDRPSWTSRFVVPPLFRGDIEFGFNAAQRLGAFGTHFAELTISWMDFSGEVAHRQVFALEEARNGAGVRFRNIILGSDGFSTSSEFVDSGDFADVAG